MSVKPPRLRRDRGAAVAGPPTCAVRCGNLISHPIRCSSVKTGGLGADREGRRDCEVRGGRPLSDSLSTAWRMRALATCAVLPPLVSIVSFARISAVVGRIPGRARSSEPDDAALSAYVGGVLRRLPPPWRYTCLRRSVVLYHLLRRAGWEVSLNIGVRKSGDGALQAHAWLVKDGAPYLEPNLDEHRAFSVIATFPETLPRHDGRLLLETLRLGGRPDDDGVRHAWSRADGPAMAAALAWEGGMQWLLRRLVEAGLENAAPAPLKAALRRAAIDERARNMLVDGETEGLVRYLNARGIPHVLIKGTARRAAAGCYPYADARATHDVDVLLPKRCVQEAWDGLRGMGWPFATDPAATPADHYHPPPLLGPHRVGVELQWSTGRDVTPEEAWRRSNDGAVDLDWNRVQVRVPSATELLWHGLTHALHHGPSGFRLRFFLDGAAILASRAAIDWDRIEARLAAGEDVDASVARAWLRAAADLAGCDLPASVRGPSAPFDIARAFAWRLAVVPRGGHEGFTGRLLEEGTRVELGLPVTPVVEGTGPFKQARRWVAGRLARLAYRTWRASARNVASRRPGWSKR
jgi:hypothetical protein